MSDELDDYIKKQAIKTPDNPDARNKILTNAKRAKQYGFDIPDDVADDFYELTSLESGRSHYLGDGKTVKTGVKTPDGDFAIGFSQVMGNTAKPYKTKGLDPYKEDDNIIIGLNEFYNGDKTDPIGRRLAYVGGANSAAYKEYKKTGRVPQGKLYSYLPKNKETYESYVANSGGYKGIDSYIKNYGKSSTPDFAGIDNYIQSVSQNAEISQPEIVKNQPANTDFPPERVPETPETINAQIQAMERGARKAVVLPPNPGGKNNIPILPKGLVTTGTPAGIVIHDPNVISVAEVQKRGDEGKLFELQGIVESESDKTNLGLIARDKNGLELQSVYVSPENVAAQTKALKAQFPDAKIEVTTAKKGTETILGERLKNQIPVQPEIVENKVDNVVADPSVSPTEQGDLNLLSQKPTVGDAQFGADFSQAKPIEIAKPNISESEISAVLKFQKLPNTLANRQKVIDTLAKNDAEGFGKVQVNASVNNPVQSPQIPESQVQPSVNNDTPAEIPQTAYQELPNQSKKQGVVKNDEDLLDTQAGRIAVDLSQKPKGMKATEFFDRAILKALQSRFGYTDEQIAKYIADGGGDWDNKEIFNGLSDEEIKARFNKPLTLTIARRAIADVMGGLNDNIRNDYKKQQQDADFELSSKKDPLEFDASNTDNLQREFNTSDYRNELQKQRDIRERGFDPELYAQAEEYVRNSPTSGGTQADIDKQYQLLKDAQVSDGTKNTLNEYGRAVRESNDSRTEMVASGIGTLLENIGDLGAGIARPFASLSQDTMFGKGYEKLYTSLQSLGNGARIFKASSKRDDWLGEVNAFTGETAIEVPKYIGMSVLPGGAVVGLTVDAALRSSGQGKNPLEIGKDTAKGLMMGVLLHNAPKIEQLAEKGLLKAVLPKAEYNAIQAGVQGASPDVKLASTVFGTVARLGTIGTGTYTTELAFGASKEDAFKASIMMSLTDLAFQAKKFGTIKDLAGKVFRMSNSKTGQTANITVEPNGEVKLLKGEVPPAAVDAEFDVANVKEAKLNKDGVYEVEGDVSPVRTKEVKEPTKSLETSPEPRALAEKNPLRIQEADSKAVERLSTDKRAQKLDEILSDGKVQSIESLAKQTKYSEENVSNALDTLYGARRIEILPDNTVRKISSEEITKPKVNLYEKYSIKPNEEPQTETSKIAPSVQSEKLVSPNVAESKPATDVKETTEKPTKIAEPTIADELNKFDVESRQGGKLVRVGDKEVQLNAEQAKRWKTEVEKPLAEAKADYDKTMESVKAMRERGDTVGAGARKESADRIYKTKAFQLAAVKREISNQLTDAERKEKLRREQSNFIGKPVSVGGQNAKVVGTSFGKVKVQFEDGSEKSFEKNKISAPIVKPENNLTIAQQAGISRDLEKWSPEKVAEKRNIPIEQVKQISPITEKGSFGKMSSLLKNDDFAGNPDLHKALGLKFNESDSKSDIMAATMDKIAGELNVPRSSHITPKDWSRWLDSNAHKIPEKVVAKVEGAILDHSDWSNRRDSFANDEKLHKFIGDVGGDIDNGVIKSFADLKPISKKAIIAKAKQYGLSEQTAKDSFNAAVSRYLERGNDEGRGELKSESADREVEKDSQKKIAGQESSERLSEGIQGAERSNLAIRLSDILKSVSKPQAEYLHTLEQDLLNLRNTPTEDLIAKARAVKRADDLRYVNKAGWELIRRARGSNSIDAGLMVPSNHVENLLYDLLDLVPKGRNEGVLQKRLRGFFEQLSTRDGDGYKNAPMVVVNRFLPKGWERGREEEILHDVVGDMLIGLPYEPLLEDENISEVVTNIRPRYKDADDATLAEEAVVKVFLKEAQDETGLSAEKLVKARDSVFKYLVENGYSFEQIQDAFEQIDKRVNYADEPIRINKATGREIKSTGEKDVSPAVRRVREIRLLREGGTTDRQDGVGKGRVYGQRPILDRNRRIELELPPAGKLIRRENRSILASKLPQQEKQSITKRALNQLYEKRGESHTPKKEVLVNFRRAGLLTSPKTHLRNLISNTAFQAGEEAARPVALLADLAASAVTGKRTVQAPSIPGILKSFKALFTDKTLKALNQESGIKTAWSILKNGDVKELEKNQLSEMRSGLPLLDKFVNTTFRLLGASDALFKTFALRRSLEEQAKSIAITKARDISWKSPIEKLKYIRAQKISLLENPTKEMLMEGLLYADFATFTNNNVISDLFKVLKDPAKDSKNESLANASKYWKAGVELLVPYDKTPTNIILRTLEYTPIGIGFAGKHLADWKKGKSYAIDQVRTKYKENWDAMDKGRENVKGLLAERTLNLLEGSNKIEDELDRLENGKLTQAQEEHLNKLKTEQEKLNKIDSRTPAQSSRLLKIQTLIDRYTAPQPMTQKRYDRISQLRKTLKRQQEKIDAYQKIKARREVKNKFRAEDRAAIEKAIEEFFPRFQQQQFAKSFGRAGLGSSALALGIYLASLGLLSGVKDWGKADERNKAKDEKEKGILEGSLKLGNRRYQITDSPLGKTMVIGASWYERSQQRLEKGESRTEKVFNDVYDTGAGTIFEQPLLNSLDDYFGSHKSKEERIGGLLGSFVPSILSDVADVIDDEKRDTKSVYGSALNRIPGARNYLPKDDERREPYLQKRSNRILNKFDPLNSRPAK